MRVIGQEQIADAFGVAPKTIVEWQALGMPIALRGGPGVPSEYELADCIRWRVSTEVGKVQGESSKDRLARLQGDRLEMDMARDRGLLVPSDEIEPLMRSAVIGAREMLLGEPARLSMLVMGRSRPDVEDLLHDAFERCLNKVSQWRSAGDDEDDAE